MPGVYLRFWRNFFRRFWLYAISLSSLAASAAVLHLFVRYRIKELIDSMAASTGASVWSLLFGFAIFKTLHHLVYFLQRVVDWHYRPKVLLEVTAFVYHKVVDQSLQWFSSQLTGNVSAKITDLYQGLEEVLNGYFWSFNNVATIFLSLFTLWKISTTAVIVLVAFIFVYVPLLAALMYRQMKLQRELTLARQSASGVLSDSIINVFAVKVVGDPERDFAVRVLPSLTLWRDWEKRCRFFDAFFVDNADTLTVITMTMVQFYFLVDNYQKGFLSPGDFAFVASITLNIHYELSQFLDKVLFYINPGLARIRASLELVANPPDVQEINGAEELVVAKGGITFDRISFAYPEQEKAVLDQLSLNILPGERIGVVGSSGSGKTTLIKSLLRYFDVNSGKVLIDGQAITEVTLRSLWRNIAIIPQDVSMFHQTIEENLLLASPSASQEELFRACEKANIHTDILKMEKGYQTSVGDRGSKLSGGQRQRIAIARAILKNCPILILDEATSALDTETEQIIQASLDSFLAETKATVIAIAHRLSTLKNMNRIIVLDQGKIVQQGTHDQLLRQEGLYKKLWQMQGC